MRTMLLVTLCAAVAILLLGAQPVSSQENSSSRDAGGVGYSSTLIYFEADGLQELAGKLGISDPPESIYLHTLNMTAQSLIALRIGRGRVGFNVQFGSTSREGTVTDGAASRNYELEFQTVGVGIQPEYDLLISDPLALVLALDIGTSYYALRVAEVMDFNGELNAALSDAPVDPSPLSIRAEQVRLALRPTAYLDLHLGSAFMLRLGAGYTYLPGDREKGWAIDNGTSIGNVPHVSTAGWFFRGGLFYGEFAGN